MLREKGDAPDVYQYERMSEGLRAQILMAMADLARLNYHATQGDSLYKACVRIMRQEKKMFKIADRGYVESEADAAEFRNWFFSESDLDYLLTGLELFLRGASTVQIIYQRDIQSRKELIGQINAYMLEDGFGFQFESGQIIEIGSTYVHKEVVVPVLGLLSKPQYATVNEEFRKAHTEFRQGDYEDCIHDCCNAFESMMKIIAAKRGWTEITEKSTVKHLVDAIFTREFIPVYMSQEFTGLRTILEGGINVVRNKAGGHGQGATPRKIDKQVAEFQLNQTAAALKLLAEYNV